MGPKQISEITALERKTPREQTKQDYAEGVSIRSIIDLATGCLFSHFLQLDDVREVLHGYDELLARGVPARSGPVGSATGERIDDRAALAQYLKSFRAMA